MDRDLLLGVIAVQLGQTTPQQVMAAASAYVVDRSRSVADRLVDAGAITPERRTMLDAMVDEALKVHGGDVRKTVASVGGDRALYASFGGSVVVNEAGDVSLAAAEDAHSVESVAAVTPEASGRYRTGAKGEIGRGGIGRVLVVFDEHLGREIAVKELLSDAGGALALTPRTGDLSRTGASAARFLREARVTGQLEHPNIVPVYEVGRRDNGTLYYTMKLVRGRTFAQALAACRTLQDRLGLLHHYVDLCNAIAYAHSRGIIHRDIKTDNVMLGEFGETVVLDWGLAKVKGRKDIRGRELERDLQLMQDDQTGKTVDGSAIGTPAYMSPEQADGSVDGIDERSDVWSLGAVLYELLTGKPPFDGVTPYEIIGKVLKDPVVPPHDRSQDVPPELSAVAVKALLRDKSKRYASAGELAEEIRAYMSGRRITAYEYSSWELIRGFVAKNRAASALAGVIALMSLVGGVFLYVAYRQAASERDRAEQQQALAEQERQRASERETAAHFNLSAALEAKAAQLIKDKRTLSARVFAAASLLHNPANPKSPHFVAAAQEQFPQARELFISAASVAYQSLNTNVAVLRKIYHADADFQRLELSNDARRLASVSLGEEAFVWDVATGKLEYTLKRTVFASFSPDGRVLVAVTQDGRVVLHDATTGKPGRPIPAGSRPYTAAFYSPDGRNLVTVDSEAEFEVRRADSLEVVKKVVRARTDPPTKRTVVALREGFLVRLRQDRSLRILDSRTGASLATIKLNRPPNTNVAVSKDASLLAVGNVDWTTTLWTAAGELLHTLEGHTEGVDAVALTRDTRLLATGGGDRTIRLWSPETGLPVTVIEGHTDPVRGLQFSQDDSTLYSSGSDKTVRAWTLDLDPPAAVLAGHRARIWRAVYSPDGRLLASASGDGTARLWDVRSKKLRATVGGISAEVMAVAFSPDGRTLAACSQDHRVRLVDTASGKVLETLEHHDAYLSGVTFSPDGRLLATSGRDSQLVLYDLARKQIVRKMRRHHTHGESGFSPDGKRIVTADKDRKINVYAVEDGRMLAQLEGHPDDTFNAEFSRDGKHIVSTGMNGHVLVWNADTYKLERRLTGHERWVNTAKYSPDDKWIATGSDEQTVRVWDAGTGETKLLIRVSAEGFCADFSPDGKQLAVVDGRDIRLYPLDFTIHDADPVALLADAERDAGMKLEGFSLRPRPFDGATSAAVH